MLIEEITEKKILFDNGTELTFRHDQSCTEKVYADFLSLKKFGDCKNIQNFEYPEDLQIERIPNTGFRFGGKNVWLFVPCYSEQNGCYSCNLTIIITYPDKTQKTLEVEDCIQKFIN